MDDSKAEQLVPLHIYSQHLRSKLTPGVFAPNAQRFVWGIGYLIAGLSFLIAIKTFALVWPLKIVLGMAAGFCFGGMGFFSHELLHGSVIRNRKLQDAFGFFGFMPFFIAPTFWRYWHNLLHHGKTQALIEDPDAFPTLRLFKHSRFMRFMFPFTPGSGHKRSSLYFLFWFSFHVFVAQTYLRFRNNIFDKMNHRRVTLEMGAQILIWGGFLSFLGVNNLVYTFLIPLIVQNYFVMSYVATNHNLSPLTRINDPLANSLTVTNHPLLEKLHLNFGYHVEHHIFPTINGAHAKQIHELLKQEYPDKYNFMPKSEAITRLYATSRIYKNSKTLVNPETGESYPVI